MWGLKIIPFSEAKTPPAREANVHEKKAQEELINSLPGKVVFDSNRTDSFGIYQSNLDGSELEVITDTAEQEIYPDVSPDGRHIVFARAADLGRDADSKVVLLDLKTKKERVLSEGTFPTFSADGKRVFFEIRRTLVMEISLEPDSLPQEIFPAKNKDFQGRKIVKPRLSPNLERLYFTSDRGGRWTAWEFNLGSGQAKKLGKGCEPTPYNASNSAAWVTKKNVLAKSAIIMKDSEDRKTIIQDDGLPYGHEYFPTLTNKDRFLFYSACPAGQHSHYEANYQVFVRDLTKDKAVRVTFDEHTNRWPKYLPPTE